jgi:hypothetical protein
MISEEKIAPIVIDFAQVREKQLDETFLQVFGNWVKLLTKAMFGQGSRGWGGDVTVRGTPREVNAFAKTIGQEKRYIEIAKKHGLDDPRTVSNRAKLRKAAAAFERETGIKWPFE